MKFIIIDSKIDITVTNGLTNVDKTNYSSRTGNVLNVAPLWCRTAIQLKKGKHNYPTEVADWETVKNLEKNNVITISRETDDGTPEEEALLKQFLESKASVEAEATPAKRKRKSSEEEAK